LRTDNGGVGPCFSPDTFIIFSVWYTGYLEAVTVCSRGQPGLKGSLGDLRAFRNEKKSARNVGVI